MERNFSGDLAEDFGKAFTLKWLNVSDTCSDECGGFRREVMFGALEDWSLKRLRSICNSIAMALQGQFDGKMTTDGDTIRFIVSYNCK